MGHLSTQEAADRLGMTRQAVLAACKRGDIIHHEGNKGYKKVVVITEYALKKYADERGIKLIGDGEREERQKRVTGIDILARRLKMRVKKEPHFAMAVAAFEAEYNRKHLIPPR